MLTWKITLPDSPHPLIISKNPGFRALYLARQNEFRFFRLINTKKLLFSFLAAGFCRKNLAFDRKIMVSFESGGCSPPAPGLYPYVQCFSTFYVKRNPLQQLRLLTKPTSFGDGTPEARRAEIRGSKPPHHQLEVLWEGCELPQRGSGWSPDRKYILNLLRA